MQTAHGRAGPVAQYQDWPLERLLLHWCQLPRRWARRCAAMRGDLQPHAVFFLSGSGPDHQALPALLAEIEHSFGSMEGLHRSMKNAAASIFGSGWVWLVCCSGGLQIVCTANQDTPLPLWPLVNMDLWEHAFLPDYEKPAGRLYGGSAGPLSTGTLPPGASRSGRLSLVRSEMLYHIRWIFQF